MRLRAMISSTIAGMESDRFLAAKTLEAIGFETLLSERASSVAEPPVKWCETAARECDLFILLLGPQYGWVIPEYDISVVEYEFNAALAADRTKVLVFVRQMLGADADPRQTVFIERVCNFTTGHFRATPYRGPDDLAARVATDVTQWLQTRLREIRFAPEGIALLTARRSLRSAVMDLWLVVLGAAVAVPAISFADPFYRRIIAWGQQLDWQRSRWILTEGGTTLAKSVTSLLLGVLLALAAMTLLIRVRRSHAPQIARFVSGGATGILVPVALVGPIWFGYDQWQVILLGTALVGSMSLPRFARFIVDLQSYRATELLVSFLATRAWVPVFVAVTTFTTVYCGIFIGGGLLEVWMMANRQLLEGIKLMSVVAFLAGLWFSIVLGDLGSRHLARLLLLKRLAHQVPIE
jgi:Domain of unknown function (DUF4062)